MMVCVSLVEGWFVVKRGQSVGGIKGTSDRIGSNLLGNKSIVV